MSQIPRTTRGVPEVTERAPSVASAPREGLPSPSSLPGTSVTLCSARHGSRGAAEEPGCRTWARPGPSPLSARPGLN